MILCEFEKWFILVASVFLLMMIYRTSCIKVPVVKNVVMPLLSLFIVMAIHLFCYSALHCQETTYLEACIENHTKSNLYMDQVDFEPSIQWTATTIECDSDKINVGPFSSEISNPPVFIRPGGTNNYLYRLKMSVHDPAQVKEDVNTVLGKLQLTWRTNLGEPGRLQTQQILGNPITQKEVELQLLELPLLIVSGMPFPVHLRLINHTHRRMGTFEVFLSQENSAEEKVIIANGLWTLALSQLEAFSSTHFILNLVATKVGILKMSGITVASFGEKKIYDTLAAIEIFVGSK